MSTALAAVDERIRVQGFSHVHITQDGKIVGDSGRMKNVVTNLGFQHYLVELLGAEAGSLQILFAAIGTGSEPGVTDTDLEGEVVKRQAVTAASTTGSKTIRFTGTFASADGFVTDTKNISNIALAASADSAGGTIFSGNTYASSSCATNQNVEFTYDVVFS